MGFMIKIAFWLGLALFLIPRDDNEKQELYSAAGRTVRDVGGFCDRNEQLCSTGRATLGFIAAQIRRGAESVEAALSETPAPTQVETRVQRQPETSRHEPPAITGTLTPDDMQPGWRS